MANTYDFTIVKGEATSFVVEDNNLDNTDVNLTGWDAKLTARAGRDESSTEAFTLTTGGGGLSVAGSIGEITVSITSTVSSLWTVDRPRLYFYELRMWQTAAPATTETVIVQGLVRVKPRVTVRA